MISKFANDTKVGGFIGSEDAHQKLQLGLDQVGGFVFWKVKPGQCMGSRRLLGQ